MAERYLIDTSAVIKYLNASISPQGLEFIDQVVNQESLLSFITAIELQAWQPDNPRDLEVYEQFVSGSFIFGISDQIIRETVSIRKFHRLKLPDALIAATATVHGLTLIGDNDKDFLKIFGLKYINPRKRSAFPAV